MSRVGRARALQERIETVLSDVGEDNVLVTIDAASAPSGYSHGVVVIIPPRLEFTTWTQTEETWGLQVAAGPWDQPLAAWEVVDRIITALQAGGINLASGEPGGVVVVEREPAWPGYLLELTPDTVYDD